MPPIHQRVPPARLGNIAIGALREVPVDITYRAVHLREVIVVVLGLLLAE